MTTDSSEKSPIEKKQHGLAGPRDWSKRPDSSRRCHAHKKNGDQCKNAALAGQSVCKYHGGGSPQAIAKARERLSAAADRMAERLLGIAESEKVPAYVALQAVNSVLDRVGITEPKQVEVTVKPIDQIFESIEGGSRSEYRQARGLPDPQSQSPANEHHDTHRHGGTLALGPGCVIDGEVVRPEADDHQDGLETRPEDDDRLEAHRRATETLANRPPPMPPADGYLPTDIAMERVAEANRAHRGQLRRR
ncbi:hypothetical protein [Mycobacterium sp. shizuoka-1]|uniref:hypothetical protein n=1 Tax=Mycobacterium sp. shizuoka-1 TaxID=2039281 RepID=UPI000C05EB90|nr:hypothetical protein [Mycobacterium sp. shizuoka-1]GAY14176.1 hypothetical protein MSZK_09020 [Mycobacterium sp. shizuoka-1]